MIGDWNNGTGRRKSSVARVFLKKGSGKIVINGKEIGDYFGRSTSIMIAKQPLVLTDITEAFDIDAQEYGDQRLEAVLRGLDGQGLEPADVCTAVLADVRQFERGAPQADDITCMALRWQGA